LLNQAFHGRGSLGAYALPVGQTILGNADALFVGCSDGVVKTNTLDEAAITAVRLSATTILKNGRALAPPRASRMTTMIYPLGDRK
jgi:hypothetical protein